MAVATGLLAVALIAFPRLDVAVSSLFWRPRAKFYLAYWWPLRVVYESVAWLTVAIIVFIVAIHGARVLSKRHLLGIDAREAWYLTLAFLVGPVVSANMVLKQLWGRPRPNKIVEFGGSKPFTPIWSIVPELDERSFPSGHAALVCYLFAFCFVMTGKRRQRAEWLVLAAGVGIGLCRVAQGAHFLSDVLFTGILMYAIAYGLHRLILGEQRQALVEAPVLVDPHGVTAQNRLGGRGTAPS